MTHNITVIELIAKLTELMVDENSIANMGICCNFDIFKADAVDIYVDRAENKIMIDGGVLYDSN